MDRSLRDSGGCGMVFSFRGSDVCWGLPWTDTSPLYSRYVGFVVTTREKKRKSVTLKVSNLIWSAIRMAATSPLKKPQQEGLEYCSVLVL